MKSTSFIISIFILALVACSVKKNSDIEIIVDEYYKTYNKRQDIDKLLGFYDNDILLEDIINGDRVKGKDELKIFLDWENPNFLMLKSDNIKINEKIISESKAVVKGCYNKFRWGENEYGPMHFTTILIFNKSGKIINQVDWINYPSNLVNYSKRKNSNEWIKQ